MAKVYLSELTEASEIYKKDFLSNDTSTSKTIAGTLSDFVNGTSSKLSGDIWNTVRAKLSEFQSVFTKFNSVSDSFCSAIESAIGLITDVIGDDCSYDYLDDGLLDSLKSELAELKTKLATLQQGTSIATTDDSGNKTTTIQYDNAAIEACEKEIKEKTALIAKTEQFKEAYDKAISILDEAFQSVESLSNEVDSIEVSTKITYNI